MRRIALFSAAPGSSVLKIPSHAKALTSTSIVQVGKQPRGAFKQTRNRYSSKSTSEQENNSRDSTSRRPTRITLFLGAAGLLGGLASYGSFSASSILSWFGISGNKLDPSRFCKYNLLSKHELSATSSVFALENPDMIDSGLERLWHEGTWSVEIKQPEIMIVRSYTPLPPTIIPGDVEPSEKLDKLRFLIRREPQGEVSGFLHRLFPPASIEVRGPYSEYKLPKELKQVVFIAGGTGIAPGMQIAYALSQRKEADSVTMRLLWANRKRDDAFGGSDSGASQNLIDQLNQLATTCFSGLSTKVFVDEEQHFISSNDIKNALDSTEKDGDQAQGTKLVLVSGPDGFIKYIAGAKQLENGQETQGTIGGLLAQHDLSGWEVWKL